MSVEATVLFTGITYKTSPDDKDDKKARMIARAKRDDTVTLADSEFERLEALGAVARKGKAASKAKADDDTPPPKEPAKASTTADPSAPTKPAEPDEAKTPTSPKRGTGKRASRRASRSSRK